MSDNTIIQRLRALGSHLVDPELTTQIFEELPDGIIVIDNGGFIQLVNRQTELIFGYHRTELFDQQVEMLLPDDLKTVHARHREDFFGSPRVRSMGIGMYLRGRRKNASLFEVEINLSPIITPQNLYVVAVVRPLSQVRSPTIVPSHGRQDG